MRIIRQSSFAAVPWKNGGGITHEAIRVPPDGDPFQWRVSIARIDVSGPFSNFAGYHRFMVLLKGAGVVLKFSGHADAAGPGSPAPRVRELRRVGDMEEFDGGVATYAELVNGPCVDLNLMVSNTLPDVRARVESLGEPRWSSLGASMLVLPIDAAVELRRGDEVSVLEPWDLALLPGREEPAVRSAASRRGGAADAVQVFLAELPAA